MLILLGLILAAIWFSLPFFLVTLYSRVKESRAALIQLEERIICLEQQLEHQFAPAETVTGTNVTAAG
ncbi:hypothetical protein JZU71_04620, partial [bacterium]|nr:hypothetical protein [bacterium]